MGAPGDGRSRFLSLDLNLEGNLALPPASVELRVILAVKGDGVGDGQVDHAVGILGEKLAEERRVG